VVDALEVTEGYSHMESICPRGGQVKIEGVDMTGGLIDINKMTQSLERGFNK